MIIGEWRSDAPVPLEPLEGAFERLAGIPLCEGCRAKCLEPLCPSCFEMALRELEARAERGEEL